MMQSDPPTPLAADLRRRWMLKPGIAFLNHGSFGALPRAIFTHQQRWRERVEAEPVEFLSRRYGERIAHAKQQIGAFLHMRPEDFALVSNATEAVASVLASLKLEPGDELVTTDHVYNAVRQAMRGRADATGARYREIAVRVPAGSSQEIVDAVVGGLGERTRLLVLDHITSPTALIFPVEAIARACAERGVDLLIDGAHAPGMIDLNVPAIGAAWYAGNLHKWACCPRALGFLWSRPDRQARTHPAIISHQFGQPFATEFEWLGTRDPSPWLSAPGALRWMSRLGWGRIRLHNDGLNRWGARMLAQRLGVEPLTGVDALLGSMSTLPLPPRLATLDEPGARRLGRRLYERHGVEVPLTCWNSRWYLRISCHVYSSPQDLDRLAAALLHESHQ